MTTVDATAGGAAPTEAAPVVGPMAGDPSIFGLGSFIAGSVALGLSLVGVVPTGVLGAPLAIILAATALGLLMATVWCAALGQSAVAAVFGIFGTFWLSYAVLVLALDHTWFAIVPTAVIATVRLFLLTWLIVMVMLTLSTLRLPSAFTAVFALVDLALLFLLLAFEQTSPLGVPSSGLLKAGGYVVLLFAAIATVRLFLLTWLIIIVMLTVSTLRLPAAFTAVFVLVDLALLLLLLAWENTSPLGAPSSGLLKAGGWVVLIFAALGAYLFYGAAQAGTGGKSLPLGPPLMH